MACATGDVLEIHECVDIRARHRGDGCCSVERDGYSRSERGIIDRIGSRAAIERVIARAAREQVIARATLKRVGLPVADDRVAKAGADDVFDIDEAVELIRRG